MIPSRMLIRSWLETKTRDEIMAELARIETEHGKESEQQVRDFLNLERKRFSEGSLLQTPAEKSLLSEHEQRKATARADIESLKKLHRDTDKS